MFKVTCVRRRGGQSLSNFYLRVRHEKGGQDMKVQSWELLGSLEKQKQI
jgi:hypothetical protein